MIGRALKLPKYCLLSIAPSGALLRPSAAIAMRSFGELALLPPPKHCSLGRFDALRARVMATAASAATASPDEIHWVGVEKDAVMSFLSLLICAGVNLHLVIRAGENGEPPASARGNAS